MSTGMSDDVGILSFQLQLGTDQAEIVIPMIATGSPPDGIDFCASLVRAADNSGLSLLTNILCEHAEVIGIQAVGGIDGKIPFRNDYALGTHVGLRTGDLEAQSVGAKMAFYFDPSDVSPGNRTACSHNTIPGISEDDTDGKALVDGLKDAVQAFADQLIDGLTDPAGTGTVWKRCNAAIRQAAADTIRIAVLAVARRIIGSVRRRLIPEFRL